MKLKYKGWMVTGIIILLITVFFVVLPFYLKSYINKNGKELTGRTLLLQGLYHNPITGYTRFRGFQMFEPDDTARFVSFDTLVINLDLYKMLGRTFSISELRLVNPLVQINHLDTVFNYTDLVERFTTDEVEETDSAESQNLNVELKNISLIRGAMSYHDLTDDREWHFDDIDIAIPGLYFDNQNTDVDLNLRLVDGGELLSNTQYNNHLGTYKINLELKDINLAAAKEYIQDYLEISDFGASLDANLEIDGKLEFLDQLTLHGTVDIKDYYFDDPHNHRFFSGDRITTAIEKIVPLTQEATIESITAINPAFLYEFFIDSTDNIRPLIKGYSDKEAERSDDESTGISPEAPELESDSTTQDFQLLIRTFNLTGGKLDFRDHNPETPFEYQFFKINAEMVNISPQDTARLTLNANAPDDGKISFGWEGNVFDLNRQAFTLKTNIPGLPAFSPYTISFFDVPIEKGRFNYISTNHINNGTLEGLHTIMASEITLGERTGFKSLYDVPLKIGLYLLEDKNGDIHMEIPVEGNVDDPEFRYSKIVVKAVINGIVKLVTSPIALIGKLVGAGDDFTDLKYHPVNIEITPDIETKLDYLAEAIAQKPQLKFSIIQHYDPEQAGKDLALYLMKQDYYKKTHDNTSIEDFYMVNNIDEKDSEFKEFVAGESGQEIGNNQSLVESCYTLKETEVQQALDTIPAAWNQRVTAYLMAKEVPPESIQIEESQNDKGKFEYELGAELLEEMGTSNPDSIAGVD